MIFHIERYWRDADTYDDYTYENVIFCDNKKAICEDCPYNMDCDEYEDGAGYVDCTITNIRSPYEAFKICSLVHTVFVHWLPRGTVLNIFKEFKLNKAMFNADYTLMYMDLIDYDGFHDYVVCDVTLMTMPSKDFWFPYISHVDRIYKNNFDALEDVVDLTAEMLANNYSIPKISIDK